MKTSTTFHLLLLLVFPLALSAQQSKWLKQQNVRVATTFNYYPSLEAYRYFSAFSQEDEDLILNFLRPNSGTFVIEEGQTIFFERNKTVSIPAQLFSIGASIQFVNQRGLFHEFALTKLSMTKASFRDDIYVIDTTGFPNLIYSYGAEEKAAAFAFRYELGKYFGDPKSNNLRFGIAGSIEPSFYTYQRTPYEFSRYPYSARIFAIDLALIPMVAARLSKKVSLDIKAIPNILIADFGSLKQENPILTEAQKQGLRQYDPPEVTLAFSVLLRYQIQEAKRTRRRNP